MLSKSCCTLSSKRGISRVKCCFSTYKRRWGNWYQAESDSFYSLRFWQCLFHLFQTCLPLDILDASEQSWDARTPLRRRKQLLPYLITINPLRNVMPFPWFGQLSVFSSCTKLSEDVRSVNWKSADHQHPRVKRTPSTFAESCSHYTDHGWKHAIAQVVATFQPAETSKTAEYK